MIGELLQQTLQIGTRSAVCLDAIAIGTGPSFYEWVRQKLPRGLRYGCGEAAKFIELDRYLLGDVVHLQHVPAGIPVYATRRVIESAPDAGQWLEFPEAELPHAGSSGGMALSLACRDHNVIGLIGFDGFGVDPAFVEAFRRLILYWQSRGKLLISLMPHSAFDDVLEHA